MDKLDEAIFKAVVANTKVGIIAQQRAKNSVDHAVYQRLVDAANNSVTEMKRLGESVNE